MSPQPPQPSSVASAGRSSGSLGTPRRPGERSPRPPWNPTTSCSPSFNRHALHSPSKEVQQRLACRMSLYLASQRTPRRKGRWRLPVEVMEMVVDFAHNDRPTLGRLGRTCRTLLVSSRYHLFETLVTAARRASTARKMSLRTLLESPYCTIKPFVKRLRFKNVDDCATVSVISALAPLLDELPALRTLIFPLVDITSIELKSAGWQALVHSQMPKRITKLVLVRAHKMSFDEFVEIVALFPALCELVCDQVDVHEGGAQLAPPPPALRTLQLGDHIFTTPDHGKAKAFLRWLALRECDAPLTLTIHADLEDVEFLQEYASAAPGALRRVKVHLHDARATPPPDLLEIILNSHYLAGLSTFTHLTAVDLGLGALWFQRCDDELAFHPAIRYMPRVLRALPPNLERLSLDVFSRRALAYPLAVEDAMFHQTWSTMDALLAGGHFRALRQVQVAVFVDEYDFTLEDEALEAFCIYVCRKLPKFVARGMLSFTRRQWDSYNDVNWLIRD